jgi:PD-(D/E)XK endonuclease
MAEETSIPIHRNSKRTGELSGAAFLLKAETLGLHVSFPWGDSERYDFILDTGSRLWRIQLKSTEVLRSRGYRINSSYGIYGQKKAAYTAADIDVMVAYVIPEDIWYILPVEVFAPVKSLHFYPDPKCRRARWEKYREAWYLLQPSLGRRPAPEPGFTLNFRE